jgi:hypothetical protein
MTNKIVTNDLFQALRFAASRQRAIHENHGVIVEIKFTATGFLIEARHTDSNKRTAEVSKRFDWFEADRWTHPEGVINGYIDRQVESFGAVKRAFGASGVEQPNMPNGVDCWPASVPLWQRGDGCPGLGDS